MRIWKNLGPQQYKVGDQGRLVQGRYAEASLCADSGTCYQQVLIKDAALLTYVSPCTMSAASVLTG